MCGDVDPLTCRIKVSKDLLFIPHFVYVNAFMSYQARCSIRISFVQHVMLRKDTWTGDKHFVKARIN